MIVLQPHEGFIINIRSFIIIHSCLLVGCLAFNPFLADSLPVPVYLGPRQTQTDPSVCNPCLAFGARGQAQEPVQVNRPPLPFFSLRRLRYAGLPPQGVVYVLVVRAAPLAVIHACLRCLLSLDNRRCPGEVVGLFSCVCSSCTCAGGAG